MLRKNFSVLLTGILLLCWAPAGSASSILGIYAGISAGKAEMDNSSPKLDSSTAKVYAGYRILGPLAIEVGQVDLGEYGSLPTSVDGTAVDLMLYLPAGPINLFAKAGLFNWNADYNGAVPANSGTDSKTGVGIEYNLVLNVDLRLEYEKFSGVGDATIDSDFTMISIGVNIAF